MAEEEEVPVVVRVGYALSSKKRLSFLQPSLVRHARRRGVLLVPVDPSHPIAEQGPFDIVLHKLPGEPWFASLAEFSSSNPAAIVIDPPDAIERLHNRVSMLQAVSDVCLPASCKETFGVPKQVVYEAGSQVIQLSEQLKFPAIAKPLVADGSENSHAMSLIFNAESLAKLTPPVVLQEFVNHGGVIFKVYVAGEHVRCVRRKSLADIQDAELWNHVEPLFFSQISNAPRSDHSCINADPDLQLVGLPPSKFVSGIASGLRKALGLHLFNFDVIRDKTAESHYYIIDINYFPGFAKMPEYESVLTDFFLDLASDKTQGINN